MALLTVDSGNLGRFLRFLVNVSSIPIKPNVGYELSLRTPNGNVLKQPMSIIRSLFAGVKGLLGTSPIEQAQVDQWLSVGVNAIKSNEIFHLQTSEQINSHLSDKCFLSCNSLTVADLSIYWALSSIPNSVVSNLSQSVHFARWFDQVQHMSYSSAKDKSECPSIQTVKLNKFVLVPNVPVPDATGLKKEKLYSDSKVDVEQKADNIDEKIRSQESEETKQIKDTKSQKKEKKPKQKESKGDDEKKEETQQTDQQENPTQLDLRVGRIIEVWKHPESEKLWCEKIDLGEVEPRQIASGLRHFYPNESDLLNRKVIVVANLKARTMAGFKSEGMVLCASNADHTEVKFLVPPSESKVGERVTFQGFQGEPLSASQVAKKNVLEKVSPLLFTTNEGVASYNGIPFQLSGGVVTSELNNSRIS